MASRLNQLATGESVFLDANTLVYHFQPHPIYGQDCSQFVSRIDQQNLAGYTSTHVLSEVAHRLMVLEAAALPGWTVNKIKLRLQQHPASLSNLTNFRLAIESILQSRVVVLSVAPALVSAAAVVSQRYSLLSNDALIIAIMQNHGLSNLASSDSDFDRVPSIMRFAPA